MSEHVFHLLNIPPDFGINFALKAAQVNGLLTERTIQHNIRRLNRIEEAVSGSDSLGVSRQSVNEVIYRLELAARGEADTKEWNFRDLRIASYNLSEIEHTPTVWNFALDLLNKHWKDIYFNGLIFYVLNYWEKLSSDFREKVCDVIKQHLQNYEGHLNRMVALKKHSDLLDENGPVRLSALLHRRKVEIEEAPTLLGLSKRTISYAYFSNVILNYFKNQHPVNLQQAEALFVLHKHKRTKKLLLAYLVKDAEEHGNEMRQTVISKFATSILGDISLNATWSPFSGATDEEREELNQARELVNRWYARRVVNVFFDVCALDPARKEFWLQYVDYVSDFKIAGSLNVRQSLMADKHVGNMFHRYFIDTNSKISNTAALVLYIHNKIFAEFSDTGSLYIYNNDRKEIKRLLNQKLITSVNDLKTTYLNSAITQIQSDYYALYEEGSVRHMGYWQERLKVWFREKMHLEPHSAIHQYQTLSEEDELYLKTH